MHMQLYTQRQSELVTNGKGVLGAAKSVPQSISGSLKIKRDLFRLWVACTGCTAYYRLDATGAR